MSGNASKMNCAEFQAKLPELIGAGEDAASHPHVQDCELCRNLLAELETIAEAARQLFTNEEPPDEVWKNIESAIQRDEKESDGLEPGVASRTR